MTVSPTVAIGAPLYNHADQLREALESILTQRYTDFGLVLIDDCSTDDTPLIAQEYAKIDRRIAYYRNDERIGLSRNWRRAFDLARELYPGAKYFAWASDHDMWHPRWLASLVAEMERYPDVVLAYPLNVRVSYSGQTVKPIPWTFETFGMNTVRERFRLTCLGMFPGKMIYGLFRLKALASVGIFHSVLLPDRLLLTELSLHGQFKQVPEILWFRRWRPGEFSHLRQRAALFPGGRPLYAYVPWWATHAAILTWNLSIRGAARPRVSRLEGLGLSLTYMPLMTFRRSRRLLSNVRRRIRRLMQRARNVTQAVTHAIPPLHRKGSGAREVQNATEPLPKKDRVTTDAPGNYAS